MTPSTGLEQLLRDQRAAWRAGTPKWAEEYLREHAWLTSDAESLLDLIYNELCLRQELGQTPSVAEYCKRFPQFNAQLAPLFSVHRVVQDWRLDDDGRGCDTVAYISKATIGPRQVGRYRLDRLLGEGAFGRVWLGFDQDLQRQVAIKVPTLERLGISEYAEAFLTEARTVAGLDHPHILPVYDVGRTDDGFVYVVSKFVEGRNLAEKIKHERPPYADAAALISTVARALHHAHEHRLIHRDIKPANILIEDRTNSPFVADFGLAVPEDDHVREGRFAGTPAYMSPEQARGEGHRLDGRSDIFSTGVVLYELLTGKRPFRGATINELRHQIISVEVVPPRRLNGEIPEELERICLKALSKQASDRYATAAEFADDLLQWRQASLRPVQEHPIVPKGLRSFDADDSDFFLDLLPGIRNRNGLPESIQFWKSRLEAVDSDRTFGVGLIFGPSGCGKSSLIKAGLLPRLSSSVTAVYVECTSEDTEGRLLRGIRKRVPDLPKDLKLTAAFAAVRRRKGPKIVVILDQFEQWLHVHHADQRAELVDALRQCDGGRVQAVIMVRDDFSMAASRLMRQLDVRIVEGHNFATVDLFDLDHARKILFKFGHAFGKLPPRLTDLSDDQNIFLSKATEGLAHEGKVVSVRLALFAEMVKDKPWVPATLDQVGGTEGIGVNFLEETFCSSSANPRHRFHQQAARAVLAGFLPEAGTDIKGHMQSHATLEEISGYRERPDDFNELLRILDGELRLITPTAPERSESDSGANPGSNGYQLTHDYLVPSLRDWLTQKQKETLRGRMELRLAERSGLWNAKRENRQLPSLWEFLCGRLLCDRKKWTDLQRQMMRKAGRLHAVRYGAATGFLLLVALGVYCYLSAQSAERAARQSENDRNRAALLVDAVMSAPAEAVPYAIGNLDELRDYAIELLDERYKDETAEASQRLRAAVALSELAEPPLDFLISRIPEAPAVECGNIATALTRRRITALDMVRDRITDADVRQAWVDKARFAIVAAHLGDTAVVQEMFALRPDPIQRTVLIDTLSSWHGDVSRLAQAAHANDDPDFHSGLCLGLGSVPLEDLAIAQRNSVIAILLDWHQSKPDAGTHSAAEWALRQWKAAPATSSTSRSPVDGRNWYVNDVGMTMLKIPVGSFTRKTATPTRGDPTKMSAKYQTVTLTQAFWLSDREVSRRIFQQFIDDPDYPNDEKPAAWPGPDLRRSPTIDHPVQYVSWFDAVLFCNWLSRKEARTPCYQTEGAEWRLNKGADGYRLPLESEWEHACRALTVTRFSSGDANSPINKYAVVLANHTEPCGSKMPNGWGVFDAHGNVYEWCQDWHHDGFGGDRSVVDPTGPATGENRVLRGGAFDYEPRYAGSPMRAMNRPTYRSFSTGFRVVTAHP